MAEIHGISIVRVGIEVDVQWELVSSIVEIEEFVHGLLVDGCHLEGAGPNVLQRRALACRYG